ncbi:transketolase [Bradyrhizobium guangdongense]|uniref:transketolase n=1 Tax=Bradyrhizobium guangdongense TaxID=1325090 RepID=UPI00112921DD|nr:transketolase [Bradyrhizobium guangdongense]TPQ36282.1 transketolase [Bradyrhizobium guangdongense]
MSNTNRPDTNLPEPKEFARRIRAHALQMVHAANASHIGGCLSMADILAVLYTRILRVDPNNARAPGRDRFVLSKGHATAILYAALAECGFFPVDELKTYCKDGSILTGHVSHAVPGVEVSTGSLGHGLPIAIGMAIAARAEGRGSRVFCLLSDGECDEGSTWEGILFAPHHGLANLCAIVDFNKIQSFGSVAEVLNLEPFADKWRAFGWHVEEVDGHDGTDLERALSAAPVASGRPVVTIAHTVKGKGVSFMENRLEWHYRAPSAEQLAAALAEVGA